MLRRAVHLSPCRMAWRLSPSSFKSLNSSSPLVQLVGGIQQSQGLWLMMIGSSQQQQRCSASWTCSSSLRPALNSVASASRINNVPPKNGAMAWNPNSNSQQQHLLMMRSPMGSRFFSEGSNPPPRVPGRWWQNRSAIGAIGTGAIILFGKTKYLLVALKLTKLATLGSMIVSIGAYSMLFGLPYAAGVVGLIAVHEGGHAWVMNRYGVPFSPAVFVPFMGAVIVMKNRPRDAWEDAMIAFGGPVAGSLGAVGIAVAGHLTDSQLCLALADFGFMVNLFNLLPIGSMDGGRIADALSPYIGVAGLGLGGYMFYEGMISNPIVVLILLAGGWHSFQRFYYPERLPANYYKITSMQRMTISGGYFGLIAALVAATAINNQYRKPPEVLQREVRQETVWDMR